MNKRPLALIAAVDQQWGIGKDNRLLCHLPKDLKHFKALTMGKAIIMGNHTFESIAKPLPGRQNVVLTRQALIARPDIDYVNDWSQALAVCDADKDVMVIGGGKIYQLALPHADTLYLTHIAHTFEADTFFPNIDLNQWRLIDELHHDPDDKHAYPFRFCCYHRQL